jgi:hypothetical protein
VPARDGKIIDYDYRGGRIRDLVKRRKLGELFRMADPCAETVSKNLHEWQSENVGDALRELLSEAVWTARMTTGNARYRLAW